MISLAATEALRPSAKGVDNIFDIALFCSTSRKVHGNVPKAPSPQIVAAADHHPSVHRAGNLQTHGCNLCHHRNAFLTTPSNVRMILSETMPLQTLSRAIHTANGGRIKLRKISRILVQAPAIAEE